MKVRNILIGLLVVLMAFVFISCEDEPAAQPQPQPGPAPVDDNTIAKFTVTAGIDGSVWKNEKIGLQWDLKKAFGEETEGIKDGSVLTLQFRTSREIHMIDLRTNGKGVIDKDSGEDIGDDVRWLYESGSLDKLDSLELGADGWYTLKYTFTDEVMRTDKKLPDYENNYYTNLLMNFAGYLMEGDVLEVKNAFLDGQALPLRETEDNKILYTTSTSSMATVEAHDWTIAKTYAVVYALGGEWRSDAGVPVEAVAAGGKATGVPATNGFAASYALGEEAFDLNTAINSDLILSYTLTPVQWTVTFDTKGGSEMQPKQVTHGTKLSLTNEELPTYPTYELLGWCTDSECTEEFDIDTQTITGNITLYANWAQNVRHVTIDLDNAEGTDDVTVQNVVDGNTVTASWFATPTNPGYFFAGWFVGDVAFNPATYGPVTADITVKAHWTEGTVTKVTATGFGGTNGADGNSVSSYEKVQFEWNLRTVFSDDDAKVEQGDVLAFQFRAERNVREYDLRTNKKTVPDKVDIRWVYEGGGDTSHWIVSDPDENGWRTVTFTFGTIVERDRYKYPGDEKETKRNEASNYAGPDYENEQYYNLLMCFRAYWLSGDIFEIKGVTLNGEEVPVVAGNVLKASFVGTPDGPDEIPDTCAVMFVGGSFTGIGYEKDEYPIVAEVEAGNTVAAPTVAGKVLTFFSDKDRSVPFDFSTPITEDTFIYYTMVDEPAP